MVEIFKTNITNKKMAQAALKSLRPVLPGCKLNFDLDDNDNILRIEYYNQLDVNFIKIHLYRYGFSIEMIE